jgi:peptidoglycan/LPS O-acetylase OafA/YrhL
MWNQVTLIARRTLIASVCLFPVYAALIGRHTDMHMALWGHTYLALLYGSLLFVTLQNTGANQLSMLRSKPAAFFARISYALYLVHTSVLLALSILSGASRDVSTWPGRLLAVSAFVLSVGICWLSYRLFEQRLIGFAHRRFVYRRASGNLGATRPASIDRLHPVDERRA